MGMKIAQLVQTKMRNDLSIEQCYNGGNITLGSGMKSCSIL